MELAINAIPETGGDRLISVASDNTIRVWDLKQVLTPASKAKTVDLGAVIALTYNKSVQLYIKCITYCSGRYSMLVKL